MLLAVETISELGFEVERTLKPLGIIGSELLESNHTVIHEGEVVLYFRKNSLNDNKFVSSSFNDTRFNQSLASLLKHIHDVIK